MSGSLSRLQRRVMEYCVAHHATGLDIYVVLFYQRHLDDDAGDGRAGWLALVEKYDGISNAGRVTVNEALPYSELQTGQYAKLSPSSLPLLTAYVMGDFLRVLSLLFVFSIRLIIFAPFFSLSLLVVARIRGHLADSSLPSLLRSVPCDYIARRTHPLLPSTIHVEFRHVSYR